MRDMEEEKSQLIERALSEPGSGPMVSSTVGRVMSTLLSAKPKKLQDAIARLHSPPKIAPVTVSLEQSLWFLHKYIGEAADEKDEHLDQVLVPMIQHSLKMRGSKQRNQSMILLNWLFQDDILFHTITRNLAGIILRKDDRYIALGWCMLGRSLIECENADNSLPTNGIREKCEMMLMIFCSCVPHLIVIICNGSKIQEGFELPTRLAVAAADFVLSLTVALTHKDLSSNNMTKKQKSLHVNAKSQPVTLALPSTGDGKLKTLKQASGSTSGIELKLLLWKNLDELVILAKKMMAWNRKSRSLHAKGLNRLIEWLQEIKLQYGFSGNEADSEMLKTGSLLLSSCWKHYGMLMHIEDHNFSLQYKELFGQYLSGIQFYADKQSEDMSKSKDSSTETNNFFLNCLLVLLGRLDSQQFGSAVTEFGSEITQVLMCQLRCADEEVIDGAISLLKAVIFRTNHISSKRSLGDFKQMDVLLPSLLNLLDDRDSAAKAVVKLLAEYISISADLKCLHEVLKGTDTKNVRQRRNAIDLVADLIHLDSESVDALSHEAWQDVATHLLGYLEDEDQTIQNQASQLIPLIDPKFVLSALVDLCYSKHQRIQLSASSALIALLINHKQEPEILCLLLDSLSILCRNRDSGTTDISKEGSILDAERLLKLVPEWAKSVDDWSPLAGPLIDKMFAEPSNAVIVRFLSHISEYLAEVADSVFHRLIFFMREQKEIDQCCSEWKGLTDTNCDSTKHEHSLFIRLCPLLVIRLLPLRVFDDLSSTVVYGQLPRDSTINDAVESNECIAALLIKSALSKSEFEDVRKLAAELCGRMHPKVLVPIVFSQLESAARTKDVWNIKVCLFSYCTCLMIRGSEAYRHPDLFHVRKIIHKILSWTSSDGDEISKAQHGCIDCLALMLCTELQAPDSSKNLNLEQSSAGNDHKRRLAAFTSSVVNYVINNLTDDGDKCIPFEYDADDGMSEATFRFSFRLCMANVLISACQKISGSAKKPFVRKILPPIIHSAGVIMEPEIRAACVQVLFSVAYHLKSSIFPYSNDLLSIALKSLRKGSHKEKMAGAKLLASLMASEEEVVESISEGLLGARSLLQNLSSTDPSPDLRQMCHQLLLCLTSH